MAKFSSHHFTQWLTFSIVFGVVLTGSLLAQNILPAQPTEIALAALPLAPNPASSSVSAVAPANPEFAAAPSAFVVVTSAPARIAPHKFWDRENRILFSATSAMATADFFVTRSNLASGGHELNPMTRPFTGSTPALASNFALESAGVVGISYLFHKTGHHRLERLTSIVDIGGSAGAVAYGLTHR